VYEHARENFSERELIGLALAAVVINGWNRLCVASINGLAWLLDES
jgi:alkylhydroperoxidase family enzyme